MFAPPIPKPTKADPAASNRARPQGSLSAFHGRRERALEKRAFPAQANAGSDFSRIPVSSPGAGPWLPWVNQGGPLATSRRIQAKFALGNLDDPLEHEADRIADHILGGHSAITAVSSAPSRPQRKCAACEKEEEEGKKGARESGHHDTIRAKPATSTTPSADAGAVGSAVTGALATPGHALDPAARSFFEPHFGRQMLTNVRVHSNPAAEKSAASIGARAYALGRDIVFARGDYQPGTSSGRWLLAHELAHVVQQSPSGGGGPQTVRRAPGKLVQQEAHTNTPAPAAPVEAPAPPAPDPNAPLPAQTGAEGTLAQPVAPPGTPGGGGVQRFVFSCKDMRLRVESESSTIIYKLKICSLPIGAYDAKVSFAKDGATGKDGKKLGLNDFRLDFSDSVSADQEFNFSYEVGPNQPDPSRLLKGQATVHVDVVEHVPIKEKDKDTAKPDETAPPKSSCVFRLKDRELVKPNSAHRDLFKPLSFDRTVWTQTIPLGEFGFVEASAKAHGDLKGSMDGHYGPGMLTDICLTHEIGSTPSTAPIKHPLLDGKSHADVNTFAIGGRARFKMNAGAHAGIVGNGKLKIAGDFLGAFEVASIEGGLSARGDASLSGDLDAMVDVVARFTQSSASLQPSTLARAATSILTPIPLPLDIVISKSSLDAIDLAAKIKLQGHASLSFGLTADAALKIFGFKLWSDSWHLKNEANLGLGWSGGLSYSPNPGIHWALGAIGKLEGIDDLLDDNEDEAHVEEGDVLDTLLNQSHGHVTVPDGLSRQNALPFNWHKPVSQYIYPGSVDIPNAQDPKTLSRDSGPTMVRYSERNRSVSERLGVARKNWPFEGKTFQYIPMGGGSTPEKDRIRGLLTRLGYDRSGTDVDHVHETQFGGDDVANNLWPADNSANRSAGTRHDSQLDNYRQQFDSIGGRWFVIAHIGV